jgi:hypothetical protein
MMKETKRRCGTNMSLNKCAGKAMLRDNSYVDRMGDNIGWLLDQLEWVQECIIVYSEEQAMKEESAHKKAIEKYGAHLLSRFQEELENQRRIAWERYRKSMKYLEMIGTDDCFVTEDQVDKGLANLSRTQTLDMIKDNFKCWEEGAGWNKQFGSATDEYSEDGCIHKFKDGKFLEPGSTETPDRVIWPSFHQAWSKDKISYLNEHLIGSLKTLIREQVQKGRPIRIAVPPPFQAKRELSSPFGTASSDYTKMKRDLNAGEVKKLEEMWAVSGATVQPKEMPTAGSLLSNKIQVLMLDTALSEAGVLRWFVGKVKSADDVEGGVEAKVEWDGEWEDEADKVTPCLLLTARDWERQHMVDNCWKLA